MSNENLTYKKQTVYEKAAPEITQAAFEYAEGYKTYLDSSKTEREAVKTSIALAEAKGYREYNLGDDIKPGDKLYYNNRGKNLFLISVGTESINKGIRIAASHIHLKIVLFTNHRTGPAAMEICSSRTIQQCR